MIIEKIEGNKVFYSWKQKQTGKTLCYNGKKEVWSMLYDELITTGDYRYEPIKDTEYDELFI